VCERPQYPKLCDNVLHSLAKIIASILLVNLSMRMCSSKGAFSTFVFNEILATQHPQWCFHVVLSCSILLITSLIITFHSSSAYSNESRVIFILEKSFLCFLFPLPN